jgi:hypothetical protein
MPKTIQSLYKTFLPPELFYKYHAYFWFIRKRNDIFAPYYLKRKGFANVFQNKFNLSGNHPFGLAFGSQNDIHRLQIATSYLRARVDAYRRKAE